MCTLLFVATGVNANPITGRYVFNINETFTEIGKDNFEKLQVQVTNWEVVMINKQVHATWKTVNDVKVAKYEIEKSITPNAFELLKAVSSMRSPGTSTYGVIDRMPSMGWNYYRLKITDEQGKITYTAVKKIFVKEEANWGLFFKQSDITSGYEASGMPLVMLHP